jgi:hypothetical protein
MFPIMSDAELIELGEDIKKNGQREPIAIIEKAVPRADGSYHVSDPRQIEVLDGRNRLDGMEAAGLEIIDEKGQLLDSVARIEIDPQEVDPWAYVISKNYHRRHVPPEKRHEIIVEYLRRDPSKSDRQIGRELGHDHKTIAKARAEQEDVGSIPHIETRVDKHGRQRPAHRPPKSSSGQVVISAEERMAQDAAEEAQRDAVRNADFAPPAPLAPQPGPDAEKPTIENVPPIAPAMPVSDPAPTPVAALITPKPSNKSCDVTAAHQQQLRICLEKAASFLTYVAARQTAADAAAFIAGEASLQMAFAKIPTGWLTALDSALAEVRTASGATVH